MRLKNVVLGYTLPKRWSSKLKLEKMRFYISGANLLTTSSLKFDNLDPEQFPTLYTPFTRTFNIRLNLNFLKTKVIKINKIISGVFSLLILSSFIGCTEIEDHPDGRTDYSDLFTTNRKTYTYMNQCYGWILNYGMNYNYTMLAGCTDEAKDSWELQNGVTRKWNEGRLSPFSDSLGGRREGNPENYNYYYQGIRACNIFLANIPTASVYSEDIRNSFKAQVLTLRAFYYLQLVKRYGGVPVVTDSRLRLYQG